jgi:hypothetical protein
MRTADELAMTGVPIVLADVPAAQPSVVEDLIDSHGNIPTTAGMSSGLG